MDCTTWRECASDHIDGTLPTKLAREADAHVLTCADCAADMAGIQTLCADLTALPAPEVPLYFSDNILSKIEAQRESAKEPWWRAARLGITTTLAGATVASFVWMQAHPVVDAPNRIRAGAGASRRIAAPAPVAAPELNTRWMLHADAATPTFDVELTLLSKSAGTAKCTITGDPHAYRFTLAPGVANHFRIPMSLVQNENIATVDIQWTSGDTTHKRIEHHPLSPESPTPRRQSFGIRDLPISDAAREVARRYNIPITLQDIPETTRIRVSPIHATAEEALTSALTGSGCTLVTTPDGLYISGK
jgi:hypothetical protein